MPARQIYTSQDARSRLLSGATKVAKAVAVTYGPGGRNVIMDRFGGLLITKDGVTVAREVGLADSVENLGCDILKEACIKVNNEVGDGTTTTAVLAQAIIEEGNKLVVAGGIDPNQLVRGLNEAATKATDFIRQLANEITEQTELERVAMLASNGDVEVAKNLAEACMAVGRDGTVTIEDGSGVETVLEFHEGMSIEEGPLSPLFLHNQVERTIENALVAVIHARLRSVDDVKDLMEVASQWPNNELVVFCLTAEGDALTTMTLNDTKGVMKCIAIGAPGVQFRKQEYLEDFAALSGATMVDMNAGMDHRTWKPEWFGSLRRVTTKHRNTTMTALPDADESIQARIVELRAQEATCTSDYDRDRLKERLAKLSGGMAVLKIGGVTEIAMKERRARVEDALGAVRAALRSGVVPGGGTTFLRASHTLDIPKDPTAKDYGFLVLKRALQKPLKVIADNTGLDGATGEVVVNNVVRGWKPVDWETGEGYDWTGWDATTGEYRDLSEDPMVMDPTEVAVATIKAAVSVAGTLLTVETAIVGAK